ncbi:hypothetical protein L1987_11987 [Smallanthus sonchifolius]|uniref:Uncharacterized protein n=1 Tax=Smallanthus sonchifolius TaxID=185202 RepID=A0ACB9JCI5_9ASTR|nr:hypothetical protein L1987_11987 [Smallanthus sonchifolius]
MTCSTAMAFFPRNFMLQASHEDDHQTPYFLSPILQTFSTTQDYHGSVASFIEKRSMSYVTDVCDQETNNGDDEVSDDGLLGGEKKKRLNMEQVKTLERNFALGNKLDPERKMQLARALGLQPRQIAIWFQNRRARWKTKQLEKDYDVLKKQFEAIKAQNDSLLTQNHKLQVELQIMALKNKEPTESINLNMKETEGSCSNKSENSSEIKLDISRTQVTGSPISSHHQQPITNLSQSSIVDRSHLQIFQNSSSRSEYHHHDHLHAQKLDQAVNNKDESFCNMFVGIEDQSGFWPWLEQPPQFN